MLKVALLAVYVGRHTSGSSMRVVLWSAWVTTPEGEAAMAAMSWREPLPPHHTRQPHTQPQYPVHQRMNRISGD